MLWAQKMIEVEKIVGQAKAEEELVGKVIAGPSREAVEPLSSGNISPFFLRNQVIFLVIQFHCFMGPPFFSKVDPLDKTSAYQIFQPDPLCSFGIVSSADESCKSEEARVTTKDEYEVDWAHSWMEVGGASIGGGGDAGVVESGISLCLVLLSLPDCSFHCFMAKPGLCDRPLFSFPGAGFTEVSQFVKGGGTAVEGRRIAKSRTSCGRIGGRGFVWAPEGSSIVLLCVLCPTPPEGCHQAPPPPYPSHPLRSPT